MHSTLYKMQHILHYICSSYHSGMASKVPGGRGLGIAREGVGAALGWCCSGHRTMVMLTLELLVALGRMCGHGSPRHVRRRTQNWICPYHQESGRAPEPEQMRPGTFHVCDVRRNLQKVPLAAIKIDLSSVHPCRVPGCTHCISP